MDVDENEQFAKTVRKVKCANQTKIETAGNHRSVQKKLTSVSPQVKKTIGTVDLSTFDHRPLIDISVGSSKLMESNEEKVYVALRVRPLSKMEIENGCNEIVSVDQSENSVLLKPLPMTKTEPKNFIFDAVFPTNAEQAELYNQVARPIVQNVLQGYNGTIFAYGQTGTGKSYTMEGERGIAELKGITPNSFAQIFSHISHESDNSTFLVRVTYLEIYNEEVRDLLVGKEQPKKLEIKENEAGVYVKNLCSFVVKSEKDMNRILAVGRKSRSVGATNMNAESSRSHAIFTVTIECSTEDAVRQSFRMGKLNLVDLAGSERASKSGATGARLKEGVKINLSLSCLGNVISALVDGKPHIPYRDSKLTRLLQDSLGGNAKTVMIANVGPADDNYEETLSTLRYADRAKRITNHAHINEDPKDAILRQFENEIQSLKKQLEEEDLKLQNAIQDTDDSIENHLSEQQANAEMLSGIKGELDTQHRLSTTVRDETEQKKSTLFRLRNDVVAWRQQQERKLELQQKLAAIQKKIMVGGECLLDKSEEQEAYLQRCMEELALRRAEQFKLKNSLASKMSEKADAEKRVRELQTKQEQAKKDAQKWLQILKREQLADEIAREEEQNEKKILEMEISKLTESIGKNSAIIETYVPEKVLSFIQDNTSYTKKSKVSKLTFKEFTGNKLNISRPYFQGPRNYTKQKDLSFAYKSLAEECTRTKVHYDEHLDTFGRSMNYTTVQPVRTRDLLTKEEDLHFHEVTDPSEASFQYQYMNICDTSDKEFFSKRTSTTPFATNNE